MDYLLRTFFQCLTCSFPLSFYANFCIFWKSDRSCWFREKFSFFLIPHMNQIMSFVFAWYLFLSFQTNTKAVFRFIWPTKERLPWVLWILWNQSNLFWRLIWALFWIYHHHKYFFYSWVTYQIWFSNFTPEHFLFIHWGKESSTGISKNIENLFLEKPWSALTPFTYRQNLVHEIIVSNASPDLQLRP